MRRTVARRAECSRSDFVCPGMSGEIGAEDRGGQGQAFEVGLCLSGDVGEGLVRRTVARRAECSRWDFVCPEMSGEIGAEDRGGRAKRSRSDFVCPGMSGRDWCGGPWRAGPNVRGRTLFVRGCRRGTGAEDRGRQGQAFEVGLCLSGDVGEGLVRRTVAGRAECSRSDFVCPGMSGRDWCGGPWRAGPNVRGRTLFVRGCRRGTGAEDRGGQGQAFEVGLCLSGDVGEGLVRRTVAGRAECSRSDFVCPGMSERDWCGGPWRAGPSVRGRTLFVRGCPGGTGAEDRGGQGRMFEVGLCLSGDVGEGLVRRTVAGRAECSRSDFVCPGMSGRDWCGGPWRAGPNVRGRLCLSGEY